VPKVSVCIPTYNTARFLGEAIESVLRQGYQDYELVVCDNASSDGTHELCQKYTDARFRYIRHEEFVGQAANWNRCVKLARGEYVVLLHADDVLLERFLERAASVLDREPSVSLVHCAVQVIAQDGSALDIQSPFSEDRIDLGESRFHQLLQQGCVINPAGVLMRRSALDAAGRFTEAVVWGVDWHMWLRLSLRGAVAYLVEPLALYRQHSQSGTTGVMAMARNGTDELWVVEDVFDHLPADREELKALYPRARFQVAHRTWCHAEQMCRSGYASAARAGVRKAVAIHPGMLFRARVWGLLASTYLGYRWFERAIKWKNRWCRQRGEPRCERQGPT
jgi:glycosyltransferase involved in cell wall biosynthesis